LHYSNASLFLNFSPAETADFPAGIYSENLPWISPGELRKARTAPKCGIHHPSEHCCGLFSVAGFKDPHITLNTERSSVEFWLLPPTVIELKVSACRAFCGVVGWANFVGNWRLAANINKRSAIFLGNQLIDIRNDMRRPDFGQIWPGQKEAEAFRPQNTL